MFAGFSLVKKLENVSLLVGNSRVIYTASFECFVIAALDYIGSSGSITQSRLYTQSDLMKYTLNTDTIASSSNFITSDLGHLKSGNNLIWQGGTLQYNATIFILKASD